MTRLKKIGLRSLVCCLLSIFVLPIAVESCYASEAVADYRTILHNIPEYSSVKREYDAVVLDAQNTFDTRIKNAKNEAEKQQLLNQYSQFCADERNRLFSPLLKKIKAVLRQIAAENGYTRILPIDSGINGPDITKQAISRLNANDSGNSKSVLSPKTKTDEGRKTSDKQQIAANNVGNTRRTASLQSPKNPTAGKIEVQFSAGYNKGDINTSVMRAKQNGLGTAYAAETKDKVGKTVWRARVRAKTITEAETLSAKLTKMGFKPFIVKE